METIPVSETMCFIVFRILDDGQSSTPSNSECYTPLSKSFRIYPKGGLFSDSPFLSKRNVLESRSSSLVMQHTT
jgi:hypothetical protein